MFVPFPFGAQLSGGFLIRSSHCRPQRHLTAPVPLGVRGWCAVPRGTVLGIPGGDPDVPSASRRTAVGTAEDTAPRAFSPSAQGR